MAEIHTAIFQAILDNVILTAMPSSLPSIPKWLDIVHRALDIEEKHSTDESKAIVKPFFESNAGDAWANQRRKRVAEEARKLIVGGWGGWEAKEAERDREVVVTVEVEVDEEAEAEAPAEEAVKNPDAFGWEFEEDGAAKATQAQEKPKGEHIPPGKEDESMDADEGWGFDESAQAGPSSPRASFKVPNGPEHSSETANLSVTDGEVDGWDFDDTAAPLAPSPPKPVIAKPAREAKRLGKKVAKVRAVAEDDPWGSGPETILTDFAPPPPLQQPRLPSQQDEAEPQNDGWGWEETPVVERTTEILAQAAPVPARNKRKELVEEKMVVHETFLISRACDKLVDMAERVLREARDLNSTS